MKRFGTKTTRRRLSAYRLSGRIPRIVIGLGLVVLIAGVWKLDRQIARSDLARFAGSPVPDGRPASLAKEQMFVGQIPGGDRHNFVLVSVTGYTSCPNQTDDTPFITATLHRTRPGTLALSRDLLRTFTRSAPFDFGDRVLIPGMGIYVVEDTMHPRWLQTADIWFHDSETARRWGRRQAYLALVDADEPRLTAEEWHPSREL